MKGRRIRKTRSNAVIEERKKKGLKEKHNCSSENIMLKVKPVERREKGPWGGSRVHLRQKKEQSRVKN